MNLNILLLSAILILSCPGCEAWGIAGNIFSGIGDWFKGIFVSIGKWLSNLVWSIGDSIKNALASMFRDIFSAMSAMQNEVNTNAQDSLGKMFGPEMFNVSNLLEGMMYTGVLPIEYYMESISVEKEFEHLDEIITNLRTAIFVWLGINLTFILSIILIVTFYCKLKKDFQIAQELETTVLKEYKLKLAKKKQIIRREVRKRAGLRGRKL